jgi:hypothetical protein
VVNGLWVMPDFVVVLCACTRNRNRIWYPDFKIGFCGAAGTIQSGYTVLMVCLIRSPALAGTRHALSLPMFNLAIYLIVNLYSKHHST